MFTTQNVVGRKGIISTQNEKWPIKSRRKLTLIEIEVESTNFLY